MRSIFTLALAAMMISPGRATCFMGEYISNPSQEADALSEAMQLILLKHFEQFLTLLTGGPGR
jgi:hypothetical protein